MRGMKILLINLFVWLGGGTCLLFSQSAGQAEQVNSCVSCHLEMGDELAVPVQGMKEDVHQDQGLSCPDCHGGDAKAGLDGDMDAAMDPAKGYIGVPKRTEIPQFCARCHSDPNYMRQYNPRVATDQLDRYKTSVHGQRLRRGDTKVATCIDCHGVHGIRSAKDARSSVYPLNIVKTCGRCHSDPEYMQEYGIDTDQVEQYSASVHGKALLEKADLAAPVCNDCHGNHGARPPGAPSIAFVCGQCHLNNRELFSKSPHRAVFDDMGLPECETCHGNHAIEHPTDDMLGAGGQSICTDCHDEGSKGLTAAVAMREQIDLLKAKIHFADSLVSVAGRAGMQVSEARFQLHDANDALIKSRTITHSLSVAETQASTEKGIKLTDAVTKAGRSALAELQFRRKGLALSIIFIAILATGLFMKIRDVDKKHPFRTEK